MIYLVSSGQILTALNGLIHVIFNNWDYYCCYSHCTEEENGAQDFKKLAQGYTDNKLGMLDPELDHSTFLSPASTNSILIGTSITVFCLFLFFFFLNMPFLFGPLFLISF